MMPTLPSMDNGKNISPWKKPGGTLGMIVAGLGIGGGIILLAKILPFLIGLTTNILTLSILVIALFALGYVITDKNFRSIVSNLYFMLMRKITGLVIEIDPIAIVEAKVKEMRNRIVTIDKNMADLNGFNRKNKDEIEKNKVELEKSIGRYKHYSKDADLKAEANVEAKKVELLQELIGRKEKRLVESEKWYKILKELKRHAELTVQDVENEVTIRKDEFESIKAQHKAFSSIMSIIKGNPNDLDNFNKAMDFMTYDINKRLGEMTYVIEETGGIMSKFNADQEISSDKAKAILAKYESGGIEALFSNKDIKPEPIKILAPIEQSKELRKF